MQRDSQGPHLAHHAQKGADLGGDLRRAAEDVRIILLESPHPRQPRQRCTAGNSAVRAAAFDEQESAGR